MIEVESMEIIQAIDVEKTRLEEFLHHNMHIELEKFIKEGYVVCYEDEIIGCFSLVALGNDAYWLKQLYVIQHEAIKLPRIVETILIIAKEMRAKIIYDHSEQPVTDLLLQSLSFSLQQEEKESVPIKCDKGHWWTYKVGS